MADTLSIIEPVDISSAYIDYIDFVMALPGNTLALTTQILIVPRAKVEYARSARLAV